jgi:hypothetical protein
MPDEVNVPLRRLILVPALITLAITLLRLTGELLRWSPSLFDRGPGGGAALVGIVWLIPVFGIWLGLQLEKADAGPAGAGRALGIAFAAFALNTALGFVTFRFVPSVPLQLLFFFLTSCLAFALARPAWPALWRVLLAYGLAARVPVLVIMFLSIFLGWDTHYAKPRPDFPPMGPWGLFLWTAMLPQLGIWMYLTIVGGLLFGAAAVGIRRLTTRKAPASVEQRGAA